MKVLVLGAGGNLGGALSSLLETQGHEVVPLVSKLGNFPFRSVPQVADLRLPEKIVWPENLDAIYYLAQSRAFRDFPAAWDDIFDINVRVPLWFADWGRRQKVKAFFYASSGGVYPAGGSAIREEDSIEANKELGFYAASRISAEVLLRNFTPHYESFSILRPFFMYGPRQNRTMLIPRLVDNVREGREIQLNGEGGIRINPVHVDDAARAFAALLGKKGSSIYNIAGPEILDLKSIALQIGEAAGKTPVFKYAGETAVDLIGDTTHMREQLVAPRIKFRDGLRTLL